MPLSTGQTLQNRYRILSLLGQGGMGAVYQAWDLALNRHCAVKEMIPDPNVDPQALAGVRAQFRREAQTLANLSHPNLPRVTDYFSLAGNEYLVMDFIEGENLQDALDRSCGQPLDEAQALDWARQLLDALEYCHARGVIHRDIKPANVRLTPEGRAVLVDFGLVKLYDPANPKTATVIHGLGTPEYTPLEQYDVGKGHTDARSDLYSLGATLFHLLTGQAPPTATQRVVNPASFVPPCSLNHQLKPSTETAILQAMELKPDHRFQSAAEMRAALSGTALVPRQVLPWVIGGVAVLVLLFGFFALFSGLGTIFTRPTPTAALVRQVTTLAPVPDKPTQTPTRRLEPTSTPTRKPTSTRRPTSTLIRKPTSTPRLTSTSTHTPAPAYTPTSPPVVEIVVTTVPEPKEPVILRYADGGADLGTMDPHFAAATQDRNLVDMIFNALIRYKPGDASVFEPDLAGALPEPRIVGGKQAWIFKLRRGVMCHPSGVTPSYELTAEDVVWSLQKSANSNRSAYAGEYDGMAIEAMDEYTVKITLDNPISPVLFYPKMADYAGGFIICKKAYEAMGAKAFETHPVGTGPFMFDRYSPEEKVVLVANDAYFRGRPLLDGVDYRFMPDINSRELGLRSGELDVIKISGLDEDALLEWVSQQEGIQVHIFGVGEVVTIHFNTTVEPLHDVRVRKAIAYALDRDEFLALFGAPVAAKAYSQVPAGFLAGGLTQAEIAELGLEYAVDREEAKELLVEAGYPNGFTLEVVSSERDAYLKIYQNMRAQLTEVGINLKINVVDHSSMHVLIREDVNPIVVYVAWRPNADVYLTRFYHSDSIVVTGVKPDTNFSHYDQIDYLIEAARVELDHNRQMELWKEAQIRILEDMVAYPLLFWTQVTARSENVEFGHELTSVMALYPQITENTRIVGK